MLNITGGTINSDDLKYIKDIKKEKNIYIILTHSDKKSPKARETIKEEIIKKFVSNNIKISIENIFFYSSDKDKCLKSQDLSEYRNKILALLKGFPKKENKEKNTKNLNNELNACYCMLNDFVSNRKKEEQSDLVYSAGETAKDNFDREVYNYSKKFLQHNINLIKDNKDYIFSYKATSFINYTVEMKPKIHLFTYSNPFNNDSYLFSQYRESIIDCIIYQFCKPYFNILKQKGTLVDSWTESGAKEEIVKAASLLQLKYYNNLEDIAARVCDLIKQLKLKEDPNYIKNKTTKIILKKLSPRWKEIDASMREIDSLLNN